MTQYKEATEFNYDLPEKFMYKNGAPNITALVKSYKELEKKLGAKKEIIKPTKHIKWKILNLLTILIYAMLPIIAYMFNANTNTLITLIGTLTLTELGLIFTTLENIKEKQ